MLMKRIGNATLYLGDCLEILPTLPKVDAVITDPPYGFSAYKTDAAISALALPYPEHASMAVFGYAEVLVGWCVERGLIPDEWVTWYPPNKMASRDVTRLPRATEHVAIFGALPGVTKLWRPRKYTPYAARRAEQRGLSADFARETDLWVDSSPGMACHGHMRQHPNEKPTALMCKLVTLCSIADGVVLDPFMGSGTTGIACTQLGRSFIGIEIDERYFDIACERIENAQRQQPMFTESQSDTRLKETQALFEQEEAQSK